MKFRIGLGKTLKQEMRTKKIHRIPEAVHHGSSRRRKITFDDNCVYVSNENHESLFQITR